MTSLCIIDGCRQRAKVNLCPDHWFALPLKLRRRWWRETDYSNNPPAPKLVADVNHQIQVGPSEPPPSLSVSVAAWRKRMGKPDAIAVVNRARSGQQVNSETDGWRGRKDSRPMKKRITSVDHPRHYSAHPSGIECIEITEHMNFCRGNAIKYIWRASEKGSEL